MNTTPDLPTDWESLPRVNRHAAGLDIGSEEIWAAVPPDHDPQPVRRFGTYTTDLLTLADWLQQCHIETVAMESTGVYWIPIFEILEARGLAVQVVNARHLKHVPGRKSDVQDCQWIQRLHTFGLLSGSFRPEAEICVRRAYLRHRAARIEHRAAHLQHLQKALFQMNVQLTQAVKDLTGKTGLRHHSRNCGRGAPSPGVGAMARWAVCQERSRDRRGLDRQLSRTARLCPEASLGVV